MDHADYCFNSRVWSTILFYYPPPVLLLRYNLLQPAVVLHTNNNKGRLGGLIFTPNLN
jgi:hypothetical protein